MVADLNNFLSHPDKPLIVHTRNVRENVRQITNLKIAELSAIFHDAGKLNPNFQNKLIGKGTAGYSNHAYLSACLFLYYCSNNYNLVLRELNNDWTAIRSVAAIIAHHHGNLPNFDSILKQKETAKLLEFLDSHPDIPVNEFLNEVTGNTHLPISLNNGNTDLLKISLLKKENQNPLRLFQQTLFSFSALLLSDKKDAGEYYETDRVKQFCSSYNETLNNYLQALKGDSKLNILRTKIRKDVCAEIGNQLKYGKRIFSLTAPTGSGKTLALLSTAGEIIREKGDFRIIYAIPFLSITEQVYDIVSNVFKNQTGSVCRIDSKSGPDKMDQLLQDLDGNPDLRKKILDIHFAEEVFDFPFIITTFVKVFETLISNKNHELLKLANFSNTIFLIDEIQALPPRLYGFFIAYLESFCRMFNSYAVISTATMPNFNLPCEKDCNLSLFFRDYTPVPELLSMDYFREKEFSRYKIHRLKGVITHDELASRIADEKRSVLLILNTIDDSKSMYSKILEIMEDTKVILLNTHFTPSDRRDKIAECSRLLRRNEKVILISTQLIEAGVDIDFPVVYRDIAPVPSIIQSAGRCNRNGKLRHKGKVVVFCLEADNKLRAALIYRGQDEKFLEYARAKVANKSFTEPEMLDIQRNYFDYARDNLMFGIHNDIDLVKGISEAAFDDIGKFRLIEESRFGKEFRYYISADDNDNNFEKLEELLEKFRENTENDFSGRKVKQIELDRHLLNMVDRIIQVRIRKNDIVPVGYGDECLGIIKLSGVYNSDTGLDLSNENQFL